MMKSLQYILVSLMVCCLSVHAYPADPVKGLLQYKPAGDDPADGSTLYMASVLVPVPVDGLPAQIKAVISSKATGQKKERFVFIGMKDNSRPAERAFSSRGGDIVAEIGIVNPEKETISLFLVYPSQEQDTIRAQHHLRVIQQKVDLTVISGK